MCAARGNTRIESRGSEDMDMQHYGHLLYELIFVCITSTYGETLFDIC
jgi:hypothetical protein